MNTIFVHEIVLLSYTKYIQKVNKNLIIIIKKNSWIWTKTNFHYTNSLNIKLLSMYRFWVWINNDTKENRNELMKYIYNDSGKLKSLLSHHIKMLSTCHFSPDNMNAVLGLLFKFIFRINKTTVKVKIDTFNYLYWRMLCRLRNTYHLRLHMTQYVSEP